MEPSLLIVFASVSGNTELVATKVKELFEKEKLFKEIEIKNALFLKDVSHLNSFSHWIIGTSTYAKGRYSPDMGTLIERIEQSQFKGKGQQVALFGLGDSSYPNFCRGIDNVSEYLEAFVNCNKWGDILRIDGFPEGENLELVDNWCKSLFELI